MTLRKGPGPRARRLALAAMALVAFGATAVAAGVVLYRIPDDERNGVLYSDVRPARGVKYQEVGDFERFSRPVVLSGGRRQIIVYYPAGEGDKGRRIAEDAWYALRLTERLTGTPFSPRADIRIFKVPEADLGVAGMYHGSDGILVSESSSYLMYHEIAHFWDDLGLFDERWQAEGYAELSAYIVGLRVRGASSAEAFRAMRLRGITDYKERDFPLDAWRMGQPTTLAREQFAYGKALAVCSLIMDRVGLAKLQQIHRQIREKRKPLDTRQYLGELEKVAGAGKLDDLYSGWILEGPYRLKDRTFTLAEYVAYLEKHPPTVPVDTGEVRLPSTASSRPVGYFVDEHGQPIGPAATQPETQPGAP